MADKFGWAPKDYLENPRVFGKEDVTPVWINDWYGEPLNEMHQDRLEAAKTQHLVALEVFRATRFRGETLAQASKHTRMGVDQFRRLMRGDGPMRLVDFATFARVYGIKFEVVESPDLRREEPATVLGERYQAPERRRPSGAS